MSSIFFCGIGGIGMSALARYLKASQEKVSGSDNTDSELLAELEKEGVFVFRSQRQENISSDVTEFIFSEAVPENHPERLAARQRNIPQKSYFAKLGELSAGFFTICVAGTHGKSGTTVMAGLALEAHHVHPNVLVGTKVFEWGKKNFRRNRSNVLLVEACEYRESFLHLHPDLIVLTDIEPDHLDYYGTEKKYFEGFRKFIASLPEDGILIADLTNPEIQKISARFSGRKIDSSKFVKKVPELLLKGEHFRRNASKVLALFSALDLNAQVAAESLQKYRGAWRRFELKGVQKGVTVLDDYGHHPTEIAATLDTLQRTYPKRRRWVVFQPHQYSRTADFLEEFGKSFFGADEIIVPDIYRVRDSEEDVARVSPQKLVSEIAKNLTEKQRVRFGDGFENTVRILKEEARSGDVVLTIGAGPVNEVGERFLSLA